MLYSVFLFYLLISFADTPTDTPRVMFDQIPEHLVAQSNLIHKINPHRESRDKDPEVKWEKETEADFKGL